MVKVFFSKLIHPFFVPALHTALSQAATFPRKLGHRHFWGNRQWKQLPVQGGVKSEQRKEAVDWTDTFLQQAEVWTR